MDSTVQKESRTLTEGELKELGTVPSQLQAGEKIAWFHEITPDQLRLQKRTGGSQIVIGPLLMFVSLFAFWANAQELIRLKITGYGWMGMLFFLGFGLIIMGIQSRKAAKVSRSVLLITNQRILRFSATTASPNGEEVWKQDCADSRYDFDGIRVYTRGKEPGQPVAIADLILVKQVGDTVLPTPYTEVKDIEGALRALQNLRPNIPIQWKNKAWNSFTQS
jgi:hypothetical protein